MRARLGVLFALLLPAGAQAQQGADVSTRFQEPAEERRIELDESETPTARRRERSASSVEALLYLRERPDALGAAAREFHDEQLQSLLRDREGLLVQRRDTAIRLLETFIAQEPENAPEMADALLRLAELRREQARAEYLRAFAAWQEVPEAHRSADPPRPDYSAANALYDRILERHRDFDRYDLVLYMKAFAEAEAGRTEAALALYRRILREFPDSRFVPDSHMALAESRFAAADFPGALERFERVLRYRESELYGMALFKSAWCLWRLNRTTDAARRFREVLDLGRGRGRVSADQRERLRELQNEALEYLIQVFTEEETNTAADVFAFLEEIGGERYADRVLVRLAGRFYEQDRWEHGVEAYELLLERLPADERAPRWALAIARGRASLGEPDETVVALERAAQGYLDGSAWARQQRDPELVREAAALIERAIRTRAMRWHDRAQRDNQAPLFERTARLYALYLEHFADSEHAYDLRFYRAEILFHRLEEWAEAGREYLAAARRDPTGRYSRDALYNAIGAFERVRESELERCAAARRNARAENGPAESDSPSDVAAEVCEESDNDRQFAAALELYVERFPDDPDLPEILFRQGRLYYNRQVFDPAVRLFGQLLERFPQSPYAITAGELILESFNRARDYQNIEAWARRLKRSPAFADEESQRRLDALILQAVFAIGEQLAERGEHAEAAAAYLRAAREFPRDPRAPQAYFNAGLEYQRAGNVGAAASAYDQLIAHHPNTEIGAQGAWTGAQMYESIAQFSDAARFYEAYGEHFPQAEHAADALYNATLLCVTAGENERAVQAGERFLARFPRHESADEVTFLIGRAHAEAGRLSEAAEVYRRFVRSARNLDRKIEASTRLAEVLAQSGDRGGADRALAEAVRLATRQRGRLGASGRYYAAQARFLQAEELLRQFDAIAISGPTEGLRQRLEEKSELLRRAAEGFAGVVQLNVAEWATAALFRIGQSYERFAEALRNAPIPEGLSEEEEMAYTDQLSSFIIPIEERALEAYEGGYQKALELRIFNRWTARLREGLTRLNDVQYPPFREMGGEIAEGAPIPIPSHLDGLRRGEATRSSEQSEVESAPSERERRTRPRRRRRR